MSNIKHCLSDHPLYQVWSDMKHRCYNKKNKKYPNYGGRGIQVCKTWLDDVYEFFIFCLSNGWKINLQIDRINNNGHYEPSNVRFVSAQQNQFNRSGNTNTTSKYKGVSWKSKNNKWCAQIQFNKTKIYIGLYNSELEAVKAYNAKAKELFGANAYINQL